MTAAIFGLIGVTLGALITGGTTYGMRRREERADMRAAARLVHSELGRAEGTLDVALGGERPEVVIPPGGFPSDEWQRYRDRFARLLTGAEWAVLEDCYNQIQTVNAVRLEWQELDEMVERIHRSKVSPRNEQAAMATIGRHAEMTFLARFYADPALRSTREARRVLSRLGQIPLKPAQREGRHDPTGDETRGR